MKKVISGQVVLTPHGEATVEYFDSVNKAVKVKHHGPYFGPITDYYLKDLKPI